MRLAKYTNARRQVDELTRRVPVSPAYPDGIHVFGGDAGLIHAFGTVDARLLPPNVDVLLSGHVHLLEQVSFASDHAAQFVSGVAGTAEDTVPLPASAPLALGALVDTMRSRLDGFGFMTMERTARTAGP